ncbi:MAG: phage tail protein [Caulobacter sp.]|nr:phage tail protein [Caulobacter sp.]
MPVIGPSAAAAVFGNVTGIHDNPYLGYNFLVEIQGLLAGGFTQVTGLDITTEVEDHRQGGNNSYAYKLPKSSSYSDIQLIRGMSDIDMLWPWYQDVVSGKIQRRNGTIYLLSNVGVPTMWWNFRRAYPVSWSGPQFDSNSSQVLSTTITLAHEGLTNPVSSAIGSIGGLI